ncbi:MAG TPA: N-acetyltransferase [Candidatus Sumerlaeota bacterium]|nr:N-acetyltransferase [Candidatus Sumerlaeota bacterium]HPS00322.1 N-acetyltransferase [Candidatus Sumerlaeota bacterium]
MPVRHIRKATIHDVESLHRLISKAAEMAPVIPRSRAALYETIRDFYVYDEGEGVRGCCALHIVWQDLAEIKSLSVDPALQKNGIGTALVRACLEEARKFKIPRIFALTAAVAFFEKLGFHTLDKGELPHKVWGDCVNCPKFPNCDEVAVQFEMTC